MKKLINLLAFIALTPLISFAQATSGAFGGVGVGGAFKSSGGNGKPFDVWNAAGSAGPAAGPELLLNFSKPPSLLFCYVFLPQHFLFRFGIRGVPDLSISFR